MFANKGVRFVTAGWLGFITENLVLSHNREYIISTYGDDEYHLAYNILSTAACSSIAYGFIKYGKLGTQLAKRGPVLQAISFGVQAMGLVGLSQLAPALQIPIVFGNKLTASSSNQSVQQENVPQGERKLYVRCPIDFKPKHSESGIHGLERTTRHPALWSLGLACLGSAITAVYPTHLVMYSFPVLFAFVGGEHQDYRYRRHNGGILTPEVDDVTSNVPFLAIIRGKQSLCKVTEEMKWTNASLALLGAVALAARRL
jgi:uncharacterized membrane protein